MAASDRNAYPMPRSVPVPNLGRTFPPPPVGSRAWRALNRLTDANIWLYRRSGGRIGGRIGRAPVLLLHHVGRKTGKERVTPLLFLPDGERLVVVASMGGSPKHPAWFVNLMASPETTVEVADRSVRVRAHEAGEEERAEYWPRLLHIYPSYGIYEGRTDRVIPVVVLDPTGER